MEIAVIINFLGDSITEGKWADCPDNSYVSVTGRELGAMVNNYGVSGTRIARRTVPYRPDFEEDFNQRYLKMDKNADFVFVFGGTNDFGHGDAPIGLPEDKTPYTFSGALNILMENLINDYGRESVCFILPLHRSNEDDPMGDHVRSTPLGTLSDFVCALLARLEAHKLDYINLNGIFTKERLDELTVDGLHPNTEGHRIIAEELAVYLRNKKSIT